VAFIAARLCRVALAPGAIDLLHGSENFLSECGYRDWKHEADCDGIVGGGGGRAGADLNMGGALVTAALSRMDACDESCIACTHGRLTVRICCFAGLRLSWAMFV